MDRPERQELFERIEAASIGGPDYYVMMVLSTALASLGLLQDSTAVVIGAMLVAPLMGPLLGGGLALVQSNAELMRRALVVLVLGIGLALLVAFAMGLINPAYEPTMEVEARGAPDILDLFIALASGMIAAWAQCRPAVSGSLAGVAIAAALVPPLAVVGIATSAGERGIAASAAILLATNVVSIVLGAALVFRLLGVNPKHEAGSVPWVRRAVATLALLAVALAAPLSLEALEKLRAGQRRPASYPVSRPVRENVAAFLARHPGVEVISMARDSVEPEAGTTVVLATREPMSATFRSELRERILQAREHSLLDWILPGRDPEPVRVYLLMEATEDRNAGGAADPGAS
jgi:uncharacterized hydrophobic protein (TIGR00271 family)